MEVLLTRILKPNQKVVVSGMRSTGMLHLGHYHGVIKNWIELQNKYTCYLFAADLHALTTHYQNNSAIAENALCNLVDWIACGVDPEQVVLFIQSQIPEHAELHLLLSMITPVAWLERVPTYKDQMQKLQHLDLATYGFLGYPLLQTADVLAYKANYIPVGEDQVPHIEFSREVARRFNHLYNSSCLTEPEALLTKSSKMPGLDGQKMSKSYNNTITLRETPKNIDQQIRTMPTDPARIKKTDPGTPEKCPVWEFHKIYSSNDTKNWVQDGCTNAKIGCIECKKTVTGAILEELAPIQAKIAEIESQPGMIQEIVAAGAKKAQEVARITLAEVKETMKIYSKIHNSRTKMINY